MIHGDLSEPAWRPKVSTEKKLTNTFEKCDQEKNDQQEKLMAFAQVVQNEAFLELEPV